MGECYVLKLSYWWRYDINDTSLTKWGWELVFYPEICGANFKSVLWTFKQQLVNKSQVHC